MSALAMILPPRGCVGGDEIISVAGAGEGAALLELVAAHVPPAMSANANAATVRPPARAIALEPTAWCVLRAHLTGQGAA